MSDVLSQLQSQAQGFQDAATRGSERVENFDVQRQTADSRAQAYAMGKAQLSNMIGSERIQQIEQLGGPLQQTAKYGYQRFFKSDNDPVQRASRFLSGAADDASSALGSAGDAVKSAVSGVSDVAEEVGSLGEGLGEMASAAAGEVPDLDTLTGKLAGEIDRPTDDVREAQLATQRASNVEDLRSIQQSNPEDIDNLRELYNSNRINGNGLAQREDNAKLLQNQIDNYKSSKGLGPELGEEPSVRTGNGSGGAQSVNNLAEDTAETAAKDAAETGAETAAKDVAETGVEMATESAVPGLGELLMAGTAIASIVHGAESEHDMPKPVIAPQLKQQNVGTSFDAAPTIDSSNYHQL